MNFRELIQGRLKCTSSLCFLVPAFLLMESVSPTKNISIRTLGENVRKNFMEQNSSCVETGSIDLERHFSWIVRENGLCNVNLLADFELEECYINSSSQSDTSAHYCSIELSSTESASTGDSCQKQNIKVALCVSAACNEKDLEKRIAESVRQSGDECLAVKNDSTICYKIGEATSYGLYLYISCCLVGFIIVIIACTAYDVLKNLENRDSDASPLIKLSKDLSVVRNYRKLTDTSTPNEKPCIHLINIVCILLIVIGQQEIFSSIYSRSQAYQLSSSRCIDVLFVISGFLTFYYGFKPMQKGSGLFLIVSVVFRWLRMMPTFCVLALFVMYVLPNFGDSITWKHRTHLETSVCESNFWSNVFCTGDFLNSNKECISISWYIRLDLQLSVVGGILLLIFTKKIKGGLITLSLIVVCTYIFAVIYSTRFADEAVRFQMSVYSRIPPYTIGFAIGVLLKFLRKRDFEFSNVQKVSFLTIAYALKIMIALCDWLIPIDRTSQWSPLMVTAYACLSRWVYVLFEATMILIYYTCGLGLLNKIIELKIIIPIGRLSYVVLLTSSVIQLLHTVNPEETSRTCTNSVPNLVTWTLIDIACSYSIGFLIHLFFEAPFSRLSKRLLKHLLRIFAKPVEEAYRISLKDEPNEDSEKSSSVDRKHSKKDANNGTGPNAFVHENKAFEDNDDILVKKL